MKLSIEGTPEEIKNAFQAICGSKERICGSKERKQFPVVKEQRGKAVIH